MTRHCFTLAEVLVALLVTAVVIPVALRAIMTVGALDESSAYRRQAVDLAELKLEELIVTGDWADGDTNGDFGDNYPGWSWELIASDWNAGEIWMRQVDLVVTGPARHGETVASLTTLMPTSEDEP